MTMPEQCIYISISEIDENIIDKVRELNECSEAFKILENSIREDNQRHPIILRLLSEDEKRSAKSGTIYGIIDGHHRYKIALDHNKSEILSVVIRTNDQTSPDILSDWQLALRLNESSIKMSSEEKGKIIYQLMQKTGKDATAIAKELFGIRISMTYHCLNAYKKSIGEPVISKPRKTTQFKIPALKSAWKEVAKYKEFPASLIDSADCFIAITKLENLLRCYKNLLNEQHDRAEEIEKRKSNKKK